MTGSGWSLDGVWAWLLLAPFLVWLGRWIYRRTRPEVPPPTRRLLWVLRGLALVLVLLVLAEPLFSWFARRARRPVVVALVDTSASMNVVERGSSRLERALEVLGGGLREDLREAVVRGFSAGSWPVSLDTLSRIAAGGLSTDLAAALLAAEEAVPDRRTLGGVLLVTDGRHNLGEDPAVVAASLGVPVFALGAGSGEPAADVQLLSAAAPGAAFAGRPVRLEIALRSWGYQGEPALVSVSTEEEELVRSQVLLGADGQLRPAEIELPPLSAGPHLLTVAVEELDGELTRQNNRRLLFLHLRRDRLRILLAAGGPGPEVALLRRALAADSSLHVAARIRRDDRSFYGGEPLPASLDDWDCLVLLDPDEELTGALGGVEGFLRSGRGLLVFAGSRLLRAPGPPRELDRLLPLSWHHPAVIEATGDPVQAAAGGRDHPLGRLLSQTGGRASWRGWPPLSGTLRGARPAPGARLLLQTSSGDPVLAAGSVGPGRVLMAAGTGFWRLDLLAAGLGEEAASLRAFWPAAVRWLAAASETGRVRSSPERPVYRAGEPVSVVAEVYDELNEPVDSARVTIVLMPGSREAAMEPAGAGRFQSSWTGLEAGEYTYQVEAGRRGDSLGRSRGRFVVESHSVEAVDLRADPGLLAEIAALSGGEYRPLEDWRDLRDRLRPPPRVVPEERRLAVEVDQYLWLGLAAVLLTGEWLIRKRGGML